MPGKQPNDEGNAPRTDLPPTREPYTDDYFGTGEEPGVVREREVGDDEDEAGGRDRNASEEAAGGDREII